MQPALPTPVLKIESRISSSAHLLRNSSFTEPREFIWRNLPCWRVSRSTSSILFHRLSLKKHKRGLLLIADCSPLHAMVVMTKIGPAQPGIVRVRCRVCEPMAKANMPSPSHTTSLLIIFWLLSIRHRIIIFSSQHSPSTIHCSGNQASHFTFHYAHHSRPPARVRIIFLCLLSQGAFSLGNSDFHSRYYYSKIEC